jgi:hypothetical protein
MLEDVTRGFSRTAHLAFELNGSKSPMNGKKATPAISEGLGKLGLPRQAVTQVSGAYSVLARQQRHLMYAATMRHIAYFDLHSTYAKSRDHRYKPTGVFIWLDGG